MLGYPLQELSSEDFGSLLKEDDSSPPEDDEDEFDPLSEDSEL